MPTDIVKDGLKQPTMFMTRSADDMRLERACAGGWSEADIALTIDTMKTTYDKLRDNGYYLDISGMFQLNLTDIPAWSPVASWLGLTGPIDNQRGFDVVNNYTLAFLIKSFVVRTAHCLVAILRRIQRLHFRQKSDLATGGFDCCENHLRYEPPRIHCVSTDNGCAHF
jgi:hypothetical protein